MMKAEPGPPMTLGGEARGGLSCASNAAIPKKENK
jgi:hypothetical protein